MKIVRAGSLTFLPASHENPRRPGSLKKILLKRGQILEAPIQMVNWGLIKKGHAFRSHFHQDLQEIFVIVSGKAQITLGRQTRLLGPGDVVIIPIKAVHRMANVGNKDLVYLVIGLSKKGQGKTVVV